jgi:hypothetical protein
MELHCAFPGAYLHPFGNYQQVEIVTALANLLLLSLTILNRMFAQKKEQRIMILVDTGMLVLGGILMF